MPKDTKTEQAVYQQTRLRLQKLLHAKPEVMRGDLANLRHGAGKKPGDDPKVWGILLSELPESMLGRYGEPSKEEWAIYTALTLYALHQQGSDPLGESVHQENVSIGKAAFQLVCLDKANGIEEDKARERIGRRFHQVALAQDMPSMVYYLRSFIQLLKANHIALDYPMLAQDIYCYQQPSLTSSVRLRWGQDYYHNAEQNENSNEKEGRSNE